MFFQLKKSLDAFFRQDLEELTRFARQQQISDGFLLRIHLLSGLYDCWSRKYAQVQYLVALTQLHCVHEGLEGADTVKASVRRPKRHCS